MAKPGRPKGSGLLYTEELAEGVCRRVSEGQSLRSACEDEGVKHPTFLLWCNERPALADRYTRARDTGRALRFERLREISAAEPERDANGKIDPGWVQWKKLHIDTEKWSLSKEEPKKYGDKLAVGGDSDNPLTIINKIERAIVKPE
jgi:hypothetical protein